MYLIYCLQKSGNSIIKFCIQKKIKYKIWDDNPVVRKNFSNKHFNNFFLNSKIKKLNLFNKIFVSPGISIRQKISNK